MISTAYRSRPTFSHEATNKFSYVDGWIGGRGGGGVKPKKKWNERPPLKLTGQTSLNVTTNLFDKLQQCIIEQVRFCLVHAREFVIFIDGLDTYRIAVALKRRNFSNVNPYEALAPSTNLVCECSSRVDKKGEENNRVLVIGSV